MSVVEFFRRRRFGPVFKTGQAIRLSKGTESNRRDVATYKLTAARNLSTEAGETNASFASEPLRKRRVPGLLPPDPGCDYRTAIDYSQISNGPVGMILTDQRDAIAKSNLLPEAIRNASVSVPALNRR